MAIFYPDILEHNNSNFALVDATQLRGNAYPLADLADTGSIPSDKRQVGTVIFASGSGKYYGFTGDDVANWDTPANWSEFVLSGAGGTDLSGVFSGSFSGSFQGDGSLLTGVTAEWDGSHLGDASITGSLIVSGANASVDFTNAEAGVSGSFSGSFVGDGSGLTGIATELPISGTSGNDTIDLQTEALTFSGSLGFTTPVTANKVEIVPPQDLRATATPTFAGLDLKGNIGFSAGDAEIVSSGGTLTIESVVFSGSAVSAITQLTASNALFDDLDVNGPATISGNITLDGAGDQTITNTAGNLNIASTGTGAHVTVDGVVMKGGTVLGTTISGSTLSSTGAVEGATLDISGDGTVGGNLTIDGDLIVSGDTTTLSTSNLLVEDRYILLNSGSSNRSDSGIIFGGAEGAAQSGSALVWDASYNSNDGRLAIVNTLASNASTDTTPDYYVGGVFLGNEANAATAEADHQGNIRIDGSEIFIYV